jgi:hypothetical protein
VIVYSVGKTFLPLISLLLVIVWNVKLQIHPFELKATSCWKSCENVKQSFEKCSCDLELIKSWNDLEDRFSCDRFSVFHHKSLTFISIQDIFVCQIAPHRCKDCQEDPASLRIVFSNHQFEAHMGVAEPHLRVSCDG